MKDLLTKDEIAAIHERASKEGLSTSKTIAAITQMLVAGEIKKPIRFGVAEFTLVGKTPLLIHRFRSGCSGLRAKGGAA